MRRLALSAVAILLCVLSIASVAQDRVEVRLVYLETLVTDSQGNTVPGLTKEDFVLSVGGKPREIDVVDANCTGGAVPDPEANAEGSWRAPVGAAQAARRIVFAFDYEHLPRIDRAPVLGVARHMLRRAKAANEEVMIAALANGVRIEQRFTKNARRLDDTLQRMENDLTLWARDFGGGVSGRAYFENLATLMDVLGQYDGPKAVVLFSSWAGRSDQNDRWFFDVAHHAAAARAALYPVYAGGLEAGAPVGGPAGLARLANESGGRSTHGTNDLSLGYARAQRDMSCRYGVGFYIDEAEKRPQRIAVRVTKPGLRTRSPEQVKFFNEEEQLEGRLRAAVVDPGNFENPYVRGHAFFISPQSKKAWDGIVALHFLMKVDPAGNDLDVVATLDRGVTPIGKFREQFHIPPTEGGAPQPVTIYGDAKLKPGPHKLTIVVNKAGLDEPQTTTTRFVIPEVPDDPIVLRGPVLSKALRSGVLIRTEKAGPETEEARAVLDSVIGDEGTFRPLLIHQVDPGDTVLAAWKACTLDKKREFSAVVERRFVDAEGKTIHELEPRALALTGKKVRCQGVLDTVSASDLGPGQHMMEVTVKDSKGEVLATALAPLRVLGG